MQAKKIPLTAALCGALLWQVTGPASAQDVAPPSPPTEMTPTTEIAPTTESEALPESVPAYEPAQYELTPPGPGSEARSETRRWPNRPLMVTSTLMFTAAYVPAVITAAVNDDDTTDNLYIPVAGPWLELAREPASPGNKALLAISGVFQDLGALGMVTSLLVPERRTSRWYLIGNKRFSAAPVADRYTYGVSARGQF